MDPRIHHVERNIPHPDELLEIVHQYGLVAVRGARIDRAEFSALAHELGNKVSHPFLPEEDGDGIARIERDADSPGSFIYGGAWHQNLMFLSQPPDVTALVAASLSDPGNFTAFVDLAEVGLWISDGLRKLLEQIQVIHSSTAPLSPQNVFGGLPQSKEDAEHPGWVVDHSTALEWPLITSNYVTNFVGWHPRESMPIVQSVYSFAAHDEFVIRHYWHQNDFLLWDNRRFMHRATVTHRTGKRLLYRADLRTGWGLR